jgi:DNA-binding NtrC family response regulator
MTTPRWPWADRPAQDATQYQGPPADAQREISMKGAGHPKVHDSRLAVLIGFSPGLEEALSIVLATSGYSVATTTSAEEAGAQRETRRADLFVASSRCSPASVVKLTESLGRPREARVLVLLAGPDSEAEREYRRAGLKHVLHMPVSADDLLRLGIQLPRGHP